MANYWKLLVVVVIVVLLSLGGLYLFLNYWQDGATQIPGRSLQTTPQIGELDYQEPNTTVIIGMKEVSRGNFEKVEGGQIYFEKYGTLTTLPLTTDEVVLACTNQDLNRAAELDYDQIASVKTMIPGELASQIPSSELIVVFAADVEGTLRAHTVAISASSCAD